MVAKVHAAVLETGKLSFPHHYPTLRYLYNTLAANIYPPSLALFSYIFVVVAQNSGTPKFNNKKKYLLGNLRYITSERSLLCR